MIKLSKKWMLALALLSTPVFYSQAQQAPKDWQNQIGENATIAREHWQQLTSGEELARGKKVTFWPAPNYRLTTDENDPYDLTDGTLSSREDDRIWFNKDAVGWWWGLGSNNGIVMQIDLGSEQPIGQIALRMLGGKEQLLLELPRWVEFLASNDGKEYHTLQRTVKVTPSERDQADGVNSFYRPEEGKAFMMSLSARQPVRARYIALRVMPVSAFYIDQISVLKAAPNTDVKTLTSYPKAQMYTDGLAILPRRSPMIVTENIITPNWLNVIDNSGVDFSKIPGTFRLELPAALRVLPQSQSRWLTGLKEVASNKMNTNAYEFTFNGNAFVGSIGPLWIEKTAELPANAEGVITTQINGEDSHSIRFGLQMISLPEVPHIEGLDVSLGWLTDREQMNWPNYLRDFRRLGFNTYSSFPRYFGKTANGKWNEFSQAAIDHLNTAREAGYKILYNESPFHVMWNTIQADLKAGKIDDAEAEQLFTQIDGKRGTRMNILYRGKYFQDEIKRVGELAAAVQPDIVQYDIEWWEPHVAESKKDPRVVAAWEKSGKSWEDFVTDMGTEVLRQLVDATRAAVPQKKILIGLYHSDPHNKIYNGIFQFDKIYPEIIDLAQPSLYVQGRAEVVADRVRHGYDNMQARQIIPWLTAGTYGEFEPRLMEPMILETILNGARGFTYYTFSDFDPMDFYYQSKALNSLAAHEELLQSGKPIAYKGDNPDLHYTAFASENKVWLLVGNYSGSANGTTTLQSPIPSITKVLLDGKSLPIINNAISIEVPPGEFRLIYLER